MNNTEHSIAIEPLRWVASLQAQGVAAVCACGWRSKPYDDPKAAQAIGDTHLRAILALTSSSKKGQK